MIRKQWQKISDKVDAMTMRERVLVFAAVAFLLITMINVFLLDPLLIDIQLKIWTVTSSLPESGPVRGQAKVG